MQGKQRVQTSRPTPAAVLRTIATALAVIAGGVTCRGGAGGPAVDMAATPAAPAQQLADGRTLAPVPDQGEATPGSAVPAPAVTRGEAEAAAECARAVAQAQPLPTGDEGGRGAAPAGAVIGPDTAARLAIRRTFGEHKALVLSLAFSSDGRTLASASGDKTIKLWPVFGGPEPSSPPLQNGSMESVAFLPGRDLLASASDDGSVRLWHTDTGKEACPRTLEFGTAVRSVAFSPDGGLLAAAGDVGRVKLVDLAEGGRVQTLDHGAAVRAVTFSSDGQLLASAGADQLVKLWTAHGGEPVAALSGHGAAVRGVTFSPDGQLLASAGAQRIILWPASGGPPVREMEHGDQVWALTFSPDGRLLASAGADGKVKLWEVVRGREIRALDGHTTRQQGLAFSPDGRLLATTDGGAVRLWGAG